MRMGLDVRWAALDILVALKVGSDVLLCKGKPTIVISTQDTG